MHYFGYYKFHCVQIRFRRNISAFFFFEGKTKTIFIQYGSKAAFITFFSSITFFLLQQSRTTQHGQARKTSCWWRPQRADRQSARLPPRAPRPPRARARCRSATPRPTQHRPLRYAIDTSARHCCYYLIIQKPLIFLQKLPDCVHSKFR